MNGILSPCSLYAIKDTLTTLRFKETAKTNKEKKKGNVIYLLTLCCAVYSLPPKF
jgi:hypothetical protein